MPLTCPRCGAQNQEGMAFCQQCGAPLSGENAPAPVPAPPPAAPTPAPTPPPVAPFPAPAPPPVVGPAVFQYAKPPRPPRHRLPGATIVGVVVGVLGVVTALAILFGHHNPIAVPVVPSSPTAVVPPTQPPQPTQAVVQPTQPPQPTQAVQPTQAAQPTQAPQPTDTAAPLPTDTPAAPPTQAPQPNPPSAPLGPTLTTQFFSVQAPSNWNVQQQTNEVQMSDPRVNPDEIDIAGGTSTSGPTTVQTVLNSVLQSLQAKSPNAAQCGKTQQATIGGKQGTIVPICFTFTPQSGAAVPAADLAFAAVSTDGSTIYVLEAMAAQNQLTGLLNDAAPVFHTLHWIGA